MTISDCVMIIALIAGPILAVQVQRWIEGWKSARERKLWVFKTLMQTRGTPLSPFHVQALNMIDLEFSVKERNVLDAWKIYLQHLAEAPQDFQSENYKSKMTLWGDKTEQFLVDLLFEMAKVLGYRFDKVQLKKGAYTPKAHKDLDQDLLLLRWGMMQVIFGNKPIYIAPIEKQQNELSPTPPSTAEITQPPPQIEVH